MRKRKEKKVEVKTGSDEVVSPEVESESATATEGGQQPDDEKAPGSLEEAKAKVETLKDSLLRAKADFQNLQRRSDRERSEAIRYANTELMKSLLGVIDDFERMLDAAENEDNPPSVVDGMRLIHDNLLKSLRQHGLQRIDALHEPFDPHVHEAMMQQPSNEHPDGTVLTEIVKGYRLHDRVIRPTRVVVSKSATPTEPSDPGGHEPMEKVQSGKGPEPSREGPEPDGERAGAK